MNLVSEFIVPSLTLAEREITRFIRQKSRVLAALGTPLLFWFVLGSGVGNSFQSKLIPEGMTYLEYFFPGTVALVILFSSIFSTISIILDRQDGFLQSVLVAPISRFGIVMGTLLGGVALSVFQGVAFVGVAYIMGLTLGLKSILWVLISLALLSFVLTGFGFMFACRMDSIQGFHGVMNLLLFPMWLLSEALFPLTAAPGWLRAIMVINPMTYGVNLLRHGFYYESNVGILMHFTMGRCLGLLTGMGILFYFISGVLLTKSQP